MSEYRFVTLWHIQAPLRDVYDAIYQSIEWPQWWPGAVHVEQLASGDDQGIGNLRRYTWQSRSWYRICFEARVTRIEPLAALEATTDGDLEGVGRWMFAHERGVTTVRYEWHVRTTRRWMNLVAPLARPLFEHNHNRLMQSGAEGLARRLGARMADVEHSRAARTKAFNRSPAAAQRHGINWLIAAASGIGAGIVATLIQIALWWIASAPLPEILFRDARLAAAIVMGTAVLPPPSAFAWNIMAVASAVHFALSICYGLMLAPFVSRLAPLPALLAGGLFGALLFGANMYGFTALFPWFEVSRDWITALAHLAFGIAAAGIYKSWERNGRLPARAA